MDINTTDINKINMKDICPMCYLNAKSHSFKMLKTSSQIQVYYSCPGEAENPLDIDAVVSHYENMLKLNNNNDWIWVIDCNNLRIKDPHELIIAKRIAQLINTKYNNLKNIYVINCNTIISIFINCVLKFFSKKIQNLVVKTDTNVLPFFIYK